MSAHHSGSGWPRAALLIFTLFLAGCASSSVPRPSPQERLETAREKTRDQTPLPAWVDVTPEQIAAVDPERFKAEGAAVVIVRGFRETFDGDRISPVKAVALRDATSGMAKMALLAQQGTEAEVAWGVATVPPGKYVPNGGPVLFRTVVRPDGTAVQQMIAPRGHANIPIERAVTIHAGDVVYVGTMLLLSRNAASNVEQMKVRDESAAAARWVKANMPNIAPRLQTRLLTGVEHMQ